MRSLLNTDLSSLHQAFSSSSSKEVSRLISRKSPSKAISAAVTLQASVDLGEGNTPKKASSMHIYSVSQACMCKSSRVNRNGAKELAADIIDAQTAIDEAKQREDRNVRVMREQLRERHPRKDSSRISGISPPMRWSRSMRSKAGLSRSVRDGMLPVSSGPGTVRRRVSRSWFLSFFQAGFA